MGERTDRYEEYTGTEEYRASRVRKARVISHICGPYLTGSTRAVDLGSGTGIIRRILEIETGNNIYGLEIDRAFIVESERMVRGDVLRMPFASESLDFALLNHLYEHVPDVGQLFRETYRVLRPGGRAYVTAGSRRAIIEPHYRLPLLSWLPDGAAGAYLRITGRGESYGDIRFLTYRPLTRLMRAAGFIVHDVTLRAIDDLIGIAWSEAWGTAWRAVRRIPDAPLHSLMRVASPQWFFLLERPARPSDHGEVA